MIKEVIPTSIRVLERGVIGWQKTGTDIMISVSDEEKDITDIFLTHEQALELVSDIMKVWKENNK